MEDSERENRCCRALLEVYAANEGTFFDKAWKVWKRNGKEDDTRSGHLEVHVPDRACTSVMLACCERDDQLEVVLGDEGVLSLQEGVDFAAAITACGTDLRKAQRIFSFAEQGDERSCKAMMRFYAKTGCGFEETLLLDSKITDKTALDVASLLVCCDSKEQAVDLIQERCIDDEALVEAIELCGDRVDKADRLFKLCKSEESSSSNHALLKVYARAGVGVVSAINAFTAMSTTDSGLLGIVFACCQTTEEFELVVNLSSDIEITAKTVAQAVENHYGNLVQILYDYLIKHCEPDEWCCQALLNTHSRANGSYEQALDVYKELSKQSTPNEWTLGAVLSCCDNEDEVKEVLETAYTTISVDLSLIRAIELVSPNTTRGEMLFGMFMEFRKSEQTLELPEADNEVVSDAEFAKYSTLLLGEVQASIRTGKCAFLTCLPSCLAQFKYQPDGSSLTGISYGCEPGVVRRRYYITDSNKRPFFKSHADIAEHMAPYLKGANWIVGKYSGNSRKSELFHAVRQVIVKTWITRCGLAWADAADFFMKNEVLAVMKAMLKSKTTRTPPRSPSKAALNVDLTTRAPEVGPSTAPSGRLLSAVPGHHALRNAYNRVLAEKGNPLKRRDLIKSRVITTLLTPISEHMDCSEALYDRRISFEEFAGEVTSRRLATTSFPSSANVIDAEGAGDLHVSVAPVPAVYAQMKRRKLATRFLSSIVSEHDPEAKQKVAKWMKQLATRHGYGQAAAESEKGAINGLLPGLQLQSKEETSIMKGTIGTEIMRIEAKKNINDWKQQEDVVQPLWLRVGSMPVLGCSYVQTFETKAEKAEKRRLEKVRREQDALGLLLPDDGRANGKKLYTIASIKQTITSRRAAGKKAIFYKSLLEAPSALQLQGEREEAMDSEQGTDDDQRVQIEGDMSVSDTLDKSANDLMPHFDEYDPSLLDDPDIKSEKKRKLLMLPTLRASVIPYSKSKDLKKDVNQQFLLTHPWIESTGLSLTGIRKAKMIMINLALQTEQRIEASTVAYAVVYFERLILKQIVTKANRKLVASVCCVLAYKFWESSTVTTAGIAVLMRSLEEHFDVARKRILAAEFKIYALLNFDLLVPQSYAEPHFERLLALYNITPQEYQNRKDNSWGLTLREEGTAPVIKSQV